MARMLRRSLRLKNDHSDDVPSVSTGENVSYTGSSSSRERSFSRCLPKIRRVLLLLTPLLLLLGLWFWGFEVWFAQFPALKVKETSSYAPRTAKVPNPAVAPESEVLTAPGEKGMNFLFDAHRISEIEKHLAAIAAEQSHQQEEYGKMMAAIAAEQSHQQEEYGKMMAAIAAEQSHQQEEYGKMMAAIAAEQSHQQEEYGKMMAAIAAEQSHQQEEYGKMMAAIAAEQIRQQEEYGKMIRKIQEQVVQLSDRSQEARVIVNNALKLYSEDKTGMADFALESAGGCILKMRCSKTYETRTSVLRIFRFQIWSFSNSPRVVIQPSMYPGDCWAMKGSRGFFAVRLSMRIYPTAFSIEHIPKALSKTGRIASAPKDFAVYGLEDAYQQKGTLLLRDVYDESGEPLQIFHVMEENQKSFPIVELQIFSNWGHRDYTCLYRFRAHGTPVKRTLYFSPPVKRIRNLFQ